MTWEPSGLGKTIFQERYSHDGESWTDACLRVSRHVAGTEKHSGYWTEQFNDELVNNRFCPGGRIWYGSGRPKAQLLNCFVIPTSDSREGWGKTVSDVIVVSGTGGGIGINCSPVRPRGSEIKGTGGRATGAVSLMQLINKVGDVIVGGGNRRAALMLCLDVDHPDIPEFLNAKLDLNQLTLANISVVINNDHNAFVESIKKGSVAPFSFMGSPNGSYFNAKDLWESLVENAWKTGEPGVLNGYLANQQSNIWYHKPLISTNPCGEIWLEEYGCCCLGALVLPRFVRDGRMDWNTLSNSIACGVRFLDDVLTVNQYPLLDIEQNCKTVRRIGFGVMGLHSMLLELGYKYSSESGRNFIDELFKFIKIKSYNTSMQLANEKGAFPAFDAESIIESGFLRDNRDISRSDIRKYGLRNCAILTIAPTGTTSMVSGVSSGIEPLFAPVYYRNYRQIDENAQEHKARELVITPEFEKYGEVAEGAYDISPREHFEVQRIVQQHIDNAVSKTINLPNNYDPGNLSHEWLEYLPYIKGSTIYRSGSRGNEPLEPVPHNEIRLAIAADKYNQTHESDWEELNSLECPGGICSIDAKH